VHTKLAPYYSPVGRPSIDLVLMIRMLIVGLSPNRNPAKAKEYRGCDGGARTHPSYLMPARGTQITPVSALLFRERKGRRQLITGTLCLEPAGPVSLVSGAGLRWWVAWARTTTPKPM
jgi:hypothetical protein